MDNGRDEHKSLAGLDSEPQGGLVVVWRANQRTHAAQLSALEKVRTLMFARTKQGENKKSYMQQLDEWLQEEVIYKLARGFEEYGAAAEAGVPQDEAAGRLDPIVAEVKKAIKEKILESYHNGKEAKSSRQWERGGKR